MAAYEIVLTDTQQAILHTIAQHTGTTEQELIRAAMDQLILHHRRTLLRQARGMWRNRTDLPDLVALRREFDRPCQGWDAQFQVMAANDNDNDRLSD